MLYQEPTKLIVLLNRLFLCNEDMQSSWSVHFTILARLLPGYRGQWLDMNKLSREVNTIISMIDKQDDIQEISLITSNELNNTWMIISSFTPLGVYSSNHYPARKTFFQHHLLLDSPSSPPSHIALSAINRTVDCHSTLAGVGLTQSNSGNP